MPLVTLQVCIGSASFFMQNVKPSRFVPLKSWIGCAETIPANARQIKMEERIFFIWKLFWQICLVNFLAIFFGHRCVVYIFLFAGFRVNERQADGVVGINGMSHVGKNDDQIFRKSLLPIVVVFFATEFQQIGNLNAVNRGE